MTTAEEAATVANSRSQATLPAFPVPGIGALLRVACLAIDMRNSGHSDETVDQWRNDAKAAIRSPSIPPES